MAPLPITRRLAWALYQEALALACLARDQTRAAPATDADGGVWHMPHVEAMPAVTALIRLVCDLQILVSSLGNGLSSGLIPSPIDAAHASRPAAAAAAYSPGFLNARVAELRRRYERLQSAVMNGTQPTASLDTRAPMEPAANDAPERSAGKRALIIDDDGIYRLLAHRALESRGWTVDDAVDGQMGWQMFQAARHDLVVTDIVMPRQDGLETIPLIRACRPDVRIVAVSGYGQLSATYLAAAVHFGADRTLVKPFTPADLMAAIEPARTAFS